MSRKFYTVHEVSVCLGIGITNTYKFVREGKIPSIKIGNQYKIPVELFEKWIEDNLVTGG